MPRQGPAPANSPEDIKAAASPEQTRPASGKPPRERSDPVTLLALVLAAFAIISAFIYIAGRNADSDRGSRVQVPPLVPKSSWK